jgi:hypothetical protein
MSDWDLTATTSGANDGAASSHPPYSQLPIAFLAALARRDSDTSLISGAGAASRAKQNDYSFLTPARLSQSGVF